MVVITGAYRRMRPGSVGFNKRMTPFSTRNLYFLHGVRRGGRGCKYKQTEFRSMGKWVNSEHPEADYKC